MPDELEPVHLSVSATGRVSILMLLDIGGQLAIYEEDHYKQIGQVHERIRLVNGKPHKFWAWYWDEVEWGQAYGEVTTRAAAVAAILSAGGYRAVEDNATIPNLLEGLE